MKSFIQNCLITDISQHPNDSSSKCPAVLEFAILFSPAQDSNLPGAFFPKDTSGILGRKVVMINTQKGKISKIPGCLLQNSMNQAFATISPNSHTLLGLLLDFSLTRRHWSIMIGQCHLPTMIYCCRTHNACIASKQVEQHYMFMRPHTTISLLEQARN